MHETQRRQHDDTLELWQRRTSRALTAEDGREIVENVSGFFRLLAKWRKASAETNSPNGEAAHATGENEELREVAPAVTKMK